MNSRESKSPVRGIKRFASYVPSYSIERSLVARENAWYDSSLRPLAIGRKTLTNWDEDCVTMSVELGRACIGASPKDEIGSVFLASTSFPFADRQHATVVSEALALKPSVGTIDIASNDSVGAQALIAAIEQDRDDDTLVLIANRQTHKVGSRLEMVSGHGGAGFVVGYGDPAVELVGYERITEDVFGRVRSHQHDAYEWEERWIRDEGALGAMPTAVGSLLAKSGVSEDELACAIFPFETDRANIALADACGINVERVASSHYGDIGHCGPAHSPLLLAEALERASPGDLILVAFLAQGCDAILFRCTDRIANNVPSTSVQTALDRQIELDCYGKYQSFCGSTDRDLGKRSEIDKAMPISVYSRSRRLLTRFEGLVCDSCSTPQVPAGAYCVNPTCCKKLVGKIAGFSDRSGKVASWTADSLTFDLAPPAYYGMVDFDGGGRMMMDFTDVRLGSPAVGQRTTNRFRIRSIDERRGNRKYFWKATVSDPVKGEPSR